MVYRLLSLLRIHAVKMRRLQCVRADGMPWCRRIKHRVVCIKRNALQYDRSARIWNVRNDAYVFGLVLSLDFTPKVSEPRI